MLKRYHITLGATTTAGGKVTSAGAFISIDGAQMALENDTVSCPTCHSQGVIKPDGPRLSERWNGRHVALNDDLCICKCSPPPRLVNSQTLKCQIIDAQQFSDQAAATAAELAKRATEDSGNPVDEVAIRLLHPETREPFKHKQYRLQLADKVIEGMTDGNGATRPLSSSERASVVAWHVGDDSGTA